MTFVLLNIEHKIEPELDGDKSGSRHFADLGPETSKVQYAHLIGLRETGDCINVSPPIDLNLAVWNADPVGWQLAHPGWVFDGRERHTDHGPATIDLDSGHDDVRPVVILLCAYRVFLGNVHPVHFTGVNV